MKVVKDGGDPTAIARESFNGQRYRCLWCNTVIEVDKHDKIEKHGWTTGSFEMDCPRCLRPADFVPYRSPAEKVTDGAAILIILTLAGAGLALCVYGFVALLGEVL